MVWLAFALTQAADGVLSYVGIATFGSHVEANPLLAWCFTAAGIAGTIAFAKLFAVACGAVLHLRAMHRSVAALTALYVAAAVAPWIVVLWPVF
jgi:hypothetical protein